MSQFVEELLNSIHNLSCDDPEYYGLEDCKEELKEFTMEELNQLTQNLQALKSMANKIKRAKARGG